MTNDDAVPKVDRDLAEQFAAWESPGASEDFIDALSRAFWSRRETAREAAIRECAAACEAHRARYEAWPHADWAMAATTCGDAVLALLERP